MKINNHVKSSKKFEVEDLLNFLAQDLNISEKTELTITYNEKLLDRLSSDVEYSALLHNTLPNKYVLYVREGNVSQFVLCHEMVHLKQYEDGRLSMSSDFKTITWEGEKMDNSIPYNLREWEKEAFSQENRLWKKYKKWRKLNK